MMVRKKKGMHLVLAILVTVTLAQSGCIVISTAGAVATTAVKSTVSIAGHTAKTVIDVAIPDGDDKDD